MSLIVSNAKATSAGVRGAARYDDGERPRAIAPAAKPKDEAAEAKALLALADAIKAQAGNLKGQQDALTALMMSNEALADGVIKALQKPAAAKPVAEQWEFTHHYVKGEIVKTTATRIK